MDLETENRIAAILLKEAAELRRQAEEEGALGYLRQPIVRGRPNSRFLTATVRSVQQANRNVEENEMWKSRQKELELDNKLKRRSRDETSSDRYRNDKRYDDTRFDSSSKERGSYDCEKREDEGLKDEELEEFLRSRTKRGRGEIGSRMDETGPYLPCKDEFSKEFDMGRWEGQGNRVCLGPEKPVSLSRCYESSDDDSPKKKKKSKKIKHESKEKSRDKKKKKKKKKREEKRYKDRRS